MPTEVYAGARSMPHPAPRLASPCSLKTLIRDGRGILSQNRAEKFHWNPSQDNVHPFDSSISAQFVPANWRGSNSQIPLRGGLAC